MIKKIIFSIIVVTCCSTKPMHQLPVEKARAQELVSRNKSSGRLSRRPAREEPTDYCNLLWNLMCLTHQFDADQYNDETNPVIPEIN